MEGDNFVVFKPSCSRSDVRKYLNTISEYLDGISTPTSVYNGAIKVTFIRYSSCDVAKYEERLPPLFFILRACESVSEIKFNSLTV